MRSITLAIWSVLLVAVSTFSVLHNHRTRFSAWRLLPENKARHLDVVPSPYSWLQVVGITQGSRGSTALGISCKGNQTVVAVGSFVWFLVWSPLVHFAFWVPSECQAWKVLDKYEIRDKYEISDKYEIRETRSRGREEAQCTHLHDLTC